MMKNKSNLGLWAAAGVCLAVFLALFSARLGWLSGFSGKRHLAPATFAAALPDRDVWMKILQNDRKIGYSHSVFEKEAENYRLREFMLLQVTVMGLAQRVELQLDALLSADLTLRSFASRLRSGQFDFSARGEIVDKTLVVTTEAEGRPHEIRLPLDANPHLSAGMIYSVCNSGMAPGDSLTVPVFDPAGMTLVPVRVKVAQKENITIMNLVQPATRLEIDFKGMTQQVWISEQCEILRESGLMGLTIEKADKFDALRPGEEGAANLTEMAAIPSNIVIDDPQGLNLLTVALTGVDLAALALDGGRQTLTGNEVTIQKEDRPSPGESEEQAGGLAAFLEPNAFIQSDDPDVRALAVEIVAPAKTDWDRAERLLRWVYLNIEKKPVVSMPNALSTLAQRRGDCNEHAMLLAALGRAAGIPAQVETGLVYMNGRFFYHAWNRFYLGRWVTLDAALGQLPADVTHIRLAGGDPDQQVNLITAIGKIRLTVTDFAPRP